MRIAHLLIVNIILILAATVGSSSSASEAKERSHFRALSYNVWYGFTRESERKSDTLDWIATQKPDLVALQELNGYTREKLEADARHWGHSNVALLKEGGFPTGLTSRQPLHDVRRVQEGFHHGLLTARVGDVQVYVIHLHPSNWEVREREIDLILDDVNEVQTEVAGVILIGDFNTFSPVDQSHYSDELIDFFARRDEELGEKNLKQGKLQYSVLQRCYQGGFTDLTHRFRRADDSVGSFPTLLRAGEDHGAKRRLDYILATPALAEECAGARIVDTPATQKLSDHLPAVADFPMWPGG